MRVPSRGVVCVSTGLPQDVRQYVRAVSEVGLLLRFITSWTYHEAGAVAKVIQAADRLFATRWGDRTAHRRASEVPSHCLLPRAWPEMRFRLGVKCGLYTNGASGWDAHGQGLDREARRLLPPDTQLLIGREDACLASFRAARKRGVKCLLDMPIVHHRTLRAALDIEYARYPGASAEPPPADDFSASRNRRKDAELDAADHVVVASRFVRDSVLAHGLPSEKVTVIPYGCQPRTDLLPFAQRPNVFLYVGHLSLRKGTPRLLAVWKRLGAYRTHTLRLIGKMLLTPRFLADYAGIFEYHPPMPRERLWPHYASARAFVFPSAGDGFGLVLNEALSAGAPVIASSHTGAPGYLESGRHGLIYPHGDDDQLAAALDRLLTRPWEAAEMGRAAHELAQKWTWADYREQFRALVLRLLAPPTAEEG